MHSIVRSVPSFLVNVTVVGPLNRSSRMFDLLICIFLLCVDCKIANALKIFQISFNLRKRLKCGRDGQPRSTACAGVGIALVDLNAQVSGVSGVFWLFCNHNVVFRYMVILP